MKKKFLKLRILLILLFFTFILSSCELFTLSFSSGTSLYNRFFFEGCKIYGQDGVYLGLITGNYYHPGSIFNKYGIYGNQYSLTSIFNPNSKYGSKSSAYSAFCNYAAFPPKIFKNGSFIRYLTTNTMRYPFITPYQLIELFKQD